MQQHRCKQLRRQHKAQHHLHNKIDSSTPTIQPLQQPLTRTTQPRPNPSPASQLHNHYNNHSPGPHLHSQNIHQLANYTTTTTITYQAQSTPTENLHQQTRLHHYSTPAHPLFFKRLPASLRGLLVQGRSSRFQELLRNSFLHDGPAAASAAHYRSQSVRWFLQCFFPRTRLLSLLVKGYRPRFTPPARRG